jgi:type IV secretory pathway VirB2 component (pilin)
MKTMAEELDDSIRIAQIALVSAVLIMVPSLLMAQTPVNSAVGNYICLIANNFMGNAGRGIATIGISVLGIGALLGKISWIQAMVVGVGVAVLFGAPYIALDLGATGICP